MILVSSSQESWVRGWVEVIRRAWLVSMFLIPRKVKQCTALWKCCCIQRRDCRYCWIQVPIGCDGTKVYLASGPISIVLSAAKTSMKNEQLMSTFLQLQQRTTICWQIVLPMVIVMNSGSAWISTYSFRCYLSRGPRIATNSSCVVRSR